MKLRPTNKTQVTGHKFLKNRAEHALDYGETAFHDHPQGRLRRAWVMGTAVAVVAMVGAAALAYFRPAPAPNDAKIFVSAAGGYFVQVGETVHPVTNLVSARLAVGEPAAAKEAADSFLASQKLGPKIGILDTPGSVAAQQVTLSVCTAAEVLTVTTETLPAPANTATIVKSPEQTLYLLKGHTRTALPAGKTGEQLAQQLGVPVAAAPSVPAGFLSAFAEQPPVAVPAGQTDVNSVLATLAPLGEQLVVKPVAGQRLCAAGEHGELTFAPQAGPQGMKVTGGVAQAFVPAPGGGFAVSTNGGLAVVAETGVVYPVAGPAELAALGVSANPVNPAVVNLLPQGATLSAAAALTPLDQTAAAAPTPPTK